MEVDHFDSTRKKDLFQDYNNLFLATRHTNGAKRDRPTRKERAAGLRFLNPCEEMDYGSEIFEQPDTHELVGISPVGRYHIRHCDLNAPHLIAERKERARMWRVLNQKPILVRKNMPFTLPSELQALKESAEKMIPPLPLLKPS